MPVSFKQKLLNKAVDRNKHLVGPYSKRDLKSYLTKRDINELLIKLIRKSGNLI